MGTRGPTLMLLPHPIATRVVEEVTDLEAMVEVEAMAEATVAVLSLIHI